MSYDVFILDDAEQDLLNIHAYIQHQFSASSANEIYQEIRDGILLLETYPELGSVIPQLAALGMTDFRHMVIMHKNKVVYELDKKNSRIFVYLICTERQDYDAVIQARIFRQ